MMLDYIFQFVDKVEFYIGAENTRSQIAITRIGAKKLREEVQGEVVKFVYALEKENWLHINQLK